MGGGLIIYFPKREQGGAGTGHTERPLQAEQALAALLFAGGGVTGRQHHQLGALKLELGGFLGGEVAVVGRVVAAC